MNLLIISLLNGLLLAALGIALLSGRPGVEHALKAFPRSQTATYILVALATAWFLFHISRLGEADYGNFKQYIGLGFFAIAVLGVLYVPDFLGVRALAALFLLVADLNLRTAYMQWEVPQRLVLVTWTYVLIVLALYLAISPFRVRDALHWLYDKTARPKIFGIGLSGFGLLLALIGFTMW